MWSKDDRRDGKRDETICLSQVSDDPGEIKSFIFLKSFHVNRVIRVRERTHIIRVASSCKSEHFQLTK